MQFSSPIDGTSDILDDDEGIPQNPGTLLDVMFVEVANLLAYAKTLPASPADVDFDRTDLLLDFADILIQARELDAKLATWPAFVPADWNPIPVSANDVPQSVISAGFYGESCDIYPDIMICSTWNEWRAARLMVLGLITRIGHPKSIHQAIETIQELVDGICASVPFSLGDRTEPGNLYEAKINYPSLPDGPISKAHQKTASAYGGWYLFAPFKETMKIGMYLRAGQRDWLSSQLMRLARMYDVVPA